MAVYESSRPLTGVAVSRKPQRGRDATTMSSAPRLVAHQPILSRARPSLPTHRISIDLASGETVVLELEAADAANAAARAIRSLAPQEAARLSFDVDSRLPEPTS